MTTTLDAMASGGMYDHIGGGFARYSTDREWLVPHFEKMLYDQALLVARVPPGALGHSAHPQYRQVVEETIEYVLRDLRHPDGGFYSAEDADSPDADGHGHEGLFHTWTPAEVRAVLARLARRPSSPEVLAWFGITDAGNFEGAHRSRTGLAPRRPRPPAARSRTPAARLFDAREQRRRPGLDDKVLTEWNALFLAALAEAAAVFGRADWMAAAVANGEFLLRELRDGRRPLVALVAGRRRADGPPPRARRRPRRPRRRVPRLAEPPARRAGSTRQCAPPTRCSTGSGTPSQGGAVHHRRGRRGLVVRQKDLVDNATPSANSMAAHGLLRLAALTGEQRYANHADRILQLLAPVIEPGTRQRVSNALLAIETRHRGITEIAVVGDRPDLVRTAQIAVAARPRARVG